MSSPSKNNYIWAEYAWLSYPSSRQYHPDIAKSCISSKSDIEYMGAYFITSVKSYVDRFTHVCDRDANLDVIYINGYTHHPTKMFGKSQSIFEDLQTFVKYRSGSKNKTKVYFFGELHDKEGSVHWNVAFFSGNTIKFFDPILDIKNDQIYDFSCRKIIAKAFNANLSLFLPLTRPQWHYKSGNYNTDIFCQTWVLMFFDFYCQGKTDEFLKLDFEQHQTTLVKQWVVQKVMKLEWDIMKDPKLKAFPYTLSGKKIHF
jgi:hypothetical protein